MNIQPIRTENDFHAAMRRLEALWGPEPGSPEENEMLVLMDLIEAYERKHTDHVLPDPVEAIKCMLDMKGMKVTDLGPVMPKNRAYEVLNYKRPLSIRMIRGLHALLGIPLECLAQEYALRPGVLIPLPAVPKAMSPTGGLRPRL
jgi:HTH-type transcriptional regulator / antitoxin HigA